MVVAPTDGALPGAQADAGHARGRDNRDLAAVSGIDVGRSAPMVGCSREGLAGLGGIMFAAVQGAPSIRNIGFEICS